MRLLNLFLMAIAASAYSGAALADPCEAPVETFHAGQSFSGQVRYIGDGDSLCVGTDRDPSTWIEVRLADFDAPELRDLGGEAAKSLLREIALGQNVQCVAGGGRRGGVVSYERVIAVCRVGGRSLGELMRRRGAPQGGN
jgi:endonuclease YncB( thermonuclease family)